MKKLLLTLSSVLIVGGAAGSVISCGVKPEKEVVFALIGGSTMSDNDLEKLNAYKEMADEFNKTHSQENGFAPIKVVWRDSNYLNNSVLSGDNLPDLYISYVDAASTYLESTVADQVRDMEDSMGEEGFAKFTNDLITPAFINEGKYKNTQVVLPFGKSFDISVINVNLLFEFMGLFKNEEVQKKLEELKKTYGDYNIERSDVLEQQTEMSKTKVFKDNLKIVNSNNSQIKSSENEIILQESNYNYLINLFTKVNNSIEGIKSIFALTDNVLELTKAMNQIILKDGLDVTVKIDNNQYVKPKERYNFAFGIDSLDNKYYMDYASTDTGTEIIDIQNSEDFWYKATYESKKANIELNSKSKSFKDTSKYLQGMKEIALSNKGQENKLTYSEQWNGVFSTSRYEQNSQSRTYITQDFTKGTMFMGGASSANDFYFTSSWTKKVDVYNSQETSAIAQENKNVTYTPVTRADIITTSKTNESNPQKAVFMSQGRGIAGFKSNGSNAAEKEESVKGFLNYIMQPIPSARFALRTSYMPATKSGMLVYENYLNGNYNNANGEPQNQTELEKAVKEIEQTYNGNEKITDSEIKELVPKYFYQIMTNGKPEWKAGISPVNTGFINDYLNPKIEDNNPNISLVSSKANPVTDIVRSGIKNSINGTNTIMDLAKKPNMSFYDLLSEAKDPKDPSYLTYWLRRNQGDFYQEININHK
ncbi:hypothetical protein [Mesoplasma florum]|uniref:hypothetical protein n=1 Tax=Mesoplasma florum TaxID=2151 RepID=UPI000BE2F9D8|nr:hypothetical protein [Mesoplasma florum]ATI73668.1 hypothetical protein CQZ70_00110 [Mesoplasma florum]